MHLFARMLEAFIMLVWIMNVVTMHDPIANKTLKETNESPRNGSGSAGATDVTNDYHTTFHHRDVSQTAKLLVVVPFAFLFITSLIYAMITCCKSRKQNEGLIVTD